MRITEGQSVFGGIAIGPVFVFKRQKQNIVLSPISDTQHEVERFEAAREETKSQLATLYATAQKRVGAENAEIFNIHAMMLDDADYVSSITHIIRTQNANAE